MRKILVSQCLYGGEPVRYDGRSKAETNQIFLEWKKDGVLIPICPEVFGGLPVPRIDAQRQGDRIVTRDGRDVTAEYLAGAKEAVRKAIEENVCFAIFKEKSPSCGSNLIYDGTFSGKLQEGKGLAAQLLEESGIKVFSENEIEAAAEMYKEINR